MAVREREIVIMGIVNMTDDSFYGASRHKGDDVAPIVESMVEQGAGIIDFGGCSTRPGSRYVGEREEWSRLEPALKCMARKSFPVRISIDSFRSSIVRRAYDLVGDIIVNDISAGEEDPRMLPLAGCLGLEYVAMHKKGCVFGAEVQCSYGRDGVVGEVMDYFRKFSLKAEGYGLRGWILDPGFGFGKDTSQNLELLDNLHSLVQTGHRLLVGLSRKRFIYEPLGLTADTCLEQVSRANLRALEQGADILRVHDVGAAARVIEIYRNGKEI